MRFAPPVQRLKSSFFYLYRWCKGQIVVFSVCTGGARGEKWFLRFAPPVQAFPKALWLLLRAIKDILQGLGSPFFRRTHVIIEVRARTFIYLSLRHACAPKQQKRRASKRVTRRMCGNSSPSIYVTEEYSVVRDFTPVRRYLPRKMECINEWNEKKQPRKGSAGVSGDDILRR